jgi:urease accessory protein
MHAEQSLLPLMAWLSPTFPTGAFAYSHGLEWAFEAGDLTGEAALADWLHALLAHGVGRNDAILFVAAYRAASVGDAAGLADSNELALALAPARELRLETAQQGRSFLDAVVAAWPAPLLDRLAPGLAEIAYPIAVGLAVAAHGLPCRAATAALVFALAQNLVSAAVRLGVVGQTGGSRVLAGLAPLCQQIGAEAQTLTLDDIGGATFRADLGSLRHENQYSRLFRS